MTDYPLEELAESALPLMQQGALIYQKFTCAACGERVAATEPNVFHTSMIHTDCPVIKNYETLTPTGNYLVIQPKTLEGLEAVRRIMES